MTKKTLIATALLMLIASTATASQFQSFDRATQVRGSELIVTGHVLSASSQWNGERTVIYTDVTVAVDEVWKGLPSSDRIVLRTLGGTVDGVMLEVDGAATFAEGEEVLLFLDSTPEGLVPFGMRFGKYQIVDGAFLVGSLPPAVTGAQKYVQVSIAMDELRAEVDSILEREGN